MIIYSWKRSESGKVSCSENEFNISMLLLSNMLSFLFKQMKAKSLSSLWLWISKYDFLNTHSQDAKTYFLKKKKCSLENKLGALDVKTRWKEFLSCTMTAQNQQSANTPCNYTKGGLGWQYSPHTLAK